MFSDNGFILPEWPAPRKIKALSTTRAGGFSDPPWGSFNFGAHVGDDPRNVRRNREKLAQSVGLPPSRFRFLNQVHGTEVVELPLESPRASAGISADASVTSEPGVPCLIMAADCLPVLFCNLAGTRVAAAHAGWRGLCAGVLEQTLSHFEAASDVMAWLGPAIGPAQFEVGPEVRDAFMAENPESERAFRPEALSDRFLADIYQLARIRLKAAGVRHLYGGHWCTVSDPTRFFSYRRDGVTGRMASLIFID